MTIEVTERPGRGGPRLVFPAHRSYRRLPRITGRTVILTLVLLIILEFVLVRITNWLTSLVGHASLALVPPLHPSVALVPSTYFGLRVDVLSFVLPNANFPAQLAWFVGGLIVLVVVIFVRRIPMPVRVVTGFAAVLVAMGAYYVMVVGQPGFDGYQASALYIRSAVLIWLLLPVLLMVSSLALPFRLWERLVLPIVCVIVDVALVIIHYAFFVWFIGSVGAIPMPMLYLLFGPTLDFMSVVAIESVALVYLSRRLSRSDTPEPWLWT